MLSYEEGLLYVIIDNSTRLLAFLASIVARQ